MIDKERLLKALYWAHEEACESSKDGRSAIKDIIDAIGYDKLGARKDGANDILNEWEDE